MKHFTELIAWRNGLDLVAEVYKLSSLFPSEERFGLTSQIRKSSTSILANVAEGFGRFTYPDKAAKYLISRGETLETEAHLFIAIHLGFISQDQASHALHLVRVEYKILSGLITACRKPKT
jgi:four helix bundle protein